MVEVKMRPEEMKDMLLRIQGVSEDLASKIVESDVTFEGLSSRSGEIQLAYGVSGGLAAKIEYAARLFVLGARGKVEGGVERDHNFIRGEMISIDAMKVLGINLRDAESIILTCANYLDLSHLRVADVSRLFGIDLRDCVMVVAWARIVVCSGSGSEDLFECLQENSGNTD